MLLSLLELNFQFLNSSCQLWFVKLLLSGLPISSLWCLQHSLHTEAQEDLYLSLLSSLRLKVCTLFMPLSTSIISIIVQIISSVSCTL